MKLDFLNRSKKRLVRFGRKFDNAVSMITKLIDRLTSVNTMIDEEIRELDDYQQELVASRESLCSAKTNNERIIHNFNALLNGE